ncbi:hypothetical protein [Halosolutus halophilus]|uniref:hypothetical protein n=1 Tax=Halosolutus halophilus TaxID=1552990 RepID=UPI0022350671|nr:hypothetical protein [Halosolutus halophilus]
MSGSGAFALVVLLALVLPVVLWLAIENETSDPTVVDRAAAERIATERGGRTASRSGDGPDSSATDRTARDERGDEDDRQADPGWGRRDDDERDEWGDRRRP